MPAPLSLRGQIPPMSQYAGTAAGRWEFARDRIAIVMYSGSAPETDEQVIARHMLAALRDVLGLKGSVLDYPDEVITTAAIVAAECSAELEGRAARRRGGFLPAVLHDPRGDDPNPLLAAHSSTLYPDAASAAARLEVLGPAFRQWRVFELREIPDGSA